MARPQANPLADPQAAAQTDPRGVSLWLAAVMALAAGVLQVVPVLAPAVAAAAELPAGFIGPWSAGIWVAALAGTLAASVLLSRIGAWSVSRLCLLACAAGAACVAIGHPAALVLAAVLIGLGQGLEAPAASHLLAARVPPAGRALWFSVKQTGVQVGAMVASFGLPWLALGFGWRAAALAAACAAALMALALHRPAKRLPVPLSTAPAGGLASSLGVLLRRPVLGWLALAAACFGSMQVALNGFFVSYAVQERGASLVQAGAWLGVAQAAGLIGRLLWGWLAGRLARILPILLALGAVMAGCAAWLGLGGPSMPLLALFGLSASGWNGIFLALVAQQVPAAEAGSATAAVLVVMTLGLVLGPLAFGGLGAVASFGSAYLAWCGVALAGCVALALAGRMNPTGDR